MRFIVAFVVSLGVLVFSQAAFSDSSSYSHEPSFYLNTGYARINPQPAFETNKDGLLLGAKATYECRSMHGRFAPGLGLQTILATGESGNLHQNFVQLSVVPEFQYGYPFFGDETTIGIWLMSPMGRGAYLKYNDADSFQVNFFGGVQLQTRWVKTWGDLIFSIGALNSFGVGQVNTWMFPLSLGFKFGGLQ